MVNSYTTFEVSSFSHSNDISVYKILKMCHVTKTMPLSWMLYHQQAGSWYGQPMYQFKVSACIHYEDMKGDAK